jgi:adenylate kinase family enzyme
MSTELPQLILFFGPPTSGKGTQSKIFLDQHPEYTKLDFGHELRTFIKNYLNHPDEPQKAQFAAKLEAVLSQRQPLDAGDLMVVLKERIVQAIENGERLVLDGAGRTLKEAELEAELFTKYNLRPCILNLYLSKEHILQRARNRWFIPDNPNPFISYEAAKQACQPNEEPYQRQDDLDETKIMAGYDNLYGDFANILLVYQLDSNANIFTIDARQSIEDVAKDVNKCLDHLNRT